MSNQMTVGKRIAFGFAVVILIAITLGIIGVWSMISAKNNSTMLAEEYVPEVDVATKINTTASNVMYEMRGYGFTENDSFYQAANGFMSELDKELQEARDLAERAVHLKALEGQVAQASSAVNEYGRLMKQTEASIQELATLRETLDTNAATYMKNCADFLESQNVAFKKELAERRTKIEVATQIAQLGTDVRVANFKGQLKQDASLMEQAITNLGNLSGYLGKLRPITRLQENIDQLNAIESAAQQYGQAMQSYVKAMRSNSTANAGSLLKQMDQAAADYVSNCEEFLKSQQDQMVTGLSERHEKITLANDVIDIGNAARLAAFKSQALRSPPVMEEAIANLGKLDEKYSALRQITRQSDNLAQIDATETAGNNYSAALTAFLSEWKSLQQLGEQRTKVGGQVVQACQTTAEAGMTNTNQLASESAKSLATNSTVMIVTLIVGTIIAVVFALWIASSITGPLNRIIAGLTEGSEQVASASGQVSAASQSLAEGATEQAAGLEETSSSLEEMSSMTKQNADNATQANGLASEARQAAHGGNEAMTRMSQAIGDIQKSSEETAKIIKVIDEIAFQTNLLALNAAVEAARAGEAGKGFAVVAEEVRNLAMRSAEAAKNTATMIEESVKNSQNGVEISSEAAKALEEIVNSIGKTTDLVGEIAAASQEQAQGIDQINTAMGQMDKVTQQNAANAEESASASEELSAQAEQMNQIVGDLIALVGGSSNKSQRSTQHSSSSASSSRQGAGASGSTGGMSDRAYHQIASGRSASPKPPTPTRKPKTAQPVKTASSGSSESSSNYEKEFPLDSDDGESFDDFTV